MEVHPAASIPGIKHADTPSNSNNFDKLVTSLAETLNLSADLIQERDWTRYAFGDSDTDYTRNLVDEGNGKGNLLVLVWTPGRGSPIHDHGNAHCVMKILKGSLTETRYAFPPQGSSHPLDIISEKTHSKNEVIYMSDELGVHRMFNKGKDFAVSLHLYTPPHVALKGCYIFDDRTGEKLHVPSSSYHSAFGRLLKEEK
ncbi:RmlC-like cupin domain-containing protein [Xylaria flabelliformis]|nr:RmlC-like cupin domain-containing protein [Xylaria flabelliformis]